MVNAHTHINYNADSAHFGSRITENYHGFVFKNITVSS